ncbi:hypothetical protein AA0472_0897 [Acetobacter estunensis NRIC 0472]|uniref:Flagellar protein FlgN n=1 Tax=Acetobacter estunensis TaxID=104097 RepID=A0A967EC79_9PROT|nr:flagellar protein FlgN [Acetobacter estunensis]MBV1836355.1 flagellar protein FlgN [Acetobacter estunensis]NHO52660.1 flagellar protein FlgN [Acetobacter estunensis]GBQ22830.1 hypothetical protein AA0472_0897 [Acetobacter estunensis NRIC 0472]
MTDEALAVIRDVTALLEEENVHLRKGDVPAAVGLLRQKEAVLMQLDALDIDCKRDPNDKDANCCSEELPAALENLENVLADNRVLLKRALTAQRHIVEILARALPSPENRTHYGKTGGYVPSRGIPGRAYRNNA